MPLNGLDISNHNYPIDPTAVPGDFVIMRASEGKGMRDEHFAGYDTKVRSSAKLAGAYHFAWVGDASGVKNTPESEAANFAAAVQGHLRPGFLPVLDWEPAHGHAARTDWAVDCALEIKRLTGRTPILYANQSTLDAGDWSRWRREIGTDYWMAGGTGQYDDRTDGYNRTVVPRNPAGWGDPIMHQYTEMGYLPGWDKRLDLNIFAGDASDWRLLADGAATPTLHPKEQTMTIPPLRENDPAVELVSSHGETLRSSNGAPRKACLCMALTFPLIEQEMIRRGLIKRTIDVFQAGYNKGKVAASAGTHDMGGVIDVAQGITLEQRKVWAEFGWMMFPRTRQYGWTTGDHGHGVIHGCPHQTVSADQQVRSGIAGRDGLVSNLVRNFEAPKRTWQDAYRAATNSKPSPTRPPLEDDMPESKHHAQTLTPNGRDWSVTDAVVLPSDGPAKASARGTVTVPADVTVTTRWVSFHGKGGDGWWRDTVVTHSPGTAETTVLVDQASPADLRLDVKTDKPCKAEVELTAQVWKK